MSRAQVRYARERHNKNMPNKNCLPKWHNVIESCLSQDTSRASRFMQLATLTLDGKPAVRTVVFRGWHYPTSVADASVANVAFTAVTDARTDKVAQVKRHPFAEICWYFQVRRQPDVSDNNIEWSTLYPAICAETSNSNV